MVKIIADSTCDLPQELLARHDIDILPLHIILGEQDYLDGQGIQPEEIYRWSDMSRTAPKTAAVALEDASAALAPYVREGREVIVFTISASMSSTYQVLCLAAEQLNPDLVHVIDSRSLSTGVGLLVIAAAELAAQGLCAGEIVTRVKALRDRVRASFVVDTLTYLHRGGRCSGAAALMGGALKLHPRITVSEGTMSATRKYRGRLERALRDYTADLTDELRTAEKAHVFITHSGCSEETVSAIRAMLEELHHFDEIHISRAGGVVSSHCGPGTLGVLFIAGA